MNNDSMNNDAMDNDPVDKSATNKTVWTIIIVIILAIAAFFVFSGNEANAPEGDTATTTEQTEQENAVDNQNGSEEVIVSYTNSGFQPSTITVEKGTSVVFKNDSSLDMWTASAQHPTHTVYAGTSLSEHCNGDASTSFDACTGIAPGVSWSFTFDKVGEWNYHNHLAPSDTGTVIVQ